MRGTSSALIENNLHTRTEFGIQHFAGPVVYDAKGFIERNSDKIPRDIILIASRSTNVIIRSELLELINDEELAVKTKRKKTSIMQKFQVQLRSLLEYMNEMQVRYIRCIKPNDRLEPTKLDHVQTLKQIKCAGLLTAIEMGRKTFPDKLPFATIVERFFCLLSPDFRKMLKDIPLHDRACLMMTYIFADSIGKFDDEERGLPYACGKTCVYFRAGAVQHLETLRQDLYFEKATTIQSWYRAKSQEAKYHLLQTSIVCMQSLYRCQKVRIQFMTLKRGASRLQAIFFSYKLRVLYKKKQLASKIIQKWFRWIRTRKNAATYVQSWWRSIKSQRNFKHQINAAVIIQSQIRTHLSCVRVNKILSAALKLTAFARMSVARARFREIQKTALLTHVASLEHENTSLPTTKKTTLETSKIDSMHLGKEIESMNNGKKVDLSKPADRIYIESNDNDKGICRYCHQLRHDDTISVNRQRIRELRQEIVHVTEEAELHNRLVEAEFEERLSDYEAEVLQLQRTVAFLESEKSALQFKMNAAQENYLNTIKLLQRGIRDTTDSHKEYLSKLMSQLEKSNEYRKAETARFSEELKSMKTSSDARIKALEADNAKLRDALEENERLRQIVSENASVLQEVNRFSRKLEKLVSPQYILSVVDAMNVSDERTAIIEKCISTKCRRTLYHLEDLILFMMDEGADLKRGHPPISEAEVISLQNQLVRAYEDMELLRDEITVLRSAESSGVSKKKATKNIFKRH